MLENHHSHFVLTGLLLLAGVGMSAPARGQEKAATPHVALINADQKPNLDANKDCIDYTLNVLNLKDNDHNVFWRQSDCIRVHITNNPFLFKYELSFNEQVVKEDDPLGSLAKPLGLSLSSVSSATDTSGHTSTQDKTANANATVKNVQNAIQDLSAEIKPADKFAAPLSSTVTRDLFTSKDALAAGNHALAITSLENAQQEIARTQTEISHTKPRVPPEDTVAVNKIQGTVTTLQNELSKGAPTPEQLARWRSSVDDLQKAADKIDQALTNKTKLYLDFNQEVGPKLRDLADDKIDLEKQPDAIPDMAQSIVNEAYAKVRQLNDDDGAHGSVESRVHEQQMVKFANDAKKLHDELEPFANSDDQESQKILEELHSDSRRVVFDACTYKTEIDNDFPTLFTGLIDPLEAVMKDGLNFTFPYVAKKREGPFADPMLVTMTLKRDNASPFGITGSTTATGKNAEYECSNDTTDLFEHGTDYYKFSDFFKEWPVQGKPNAYTRNQNKPKPKSTDGSGGSTVSNPSGKTTTPKSSAPDAPSTDVLEQPWTFGRPRWVVSGGVSTGILSKQEFQRTMTVSNGTSETVVGLKTDSTFRISPMLFAHTLLAYSRHDADAWYATLGVTSSSDNQSTVPEFLVGISRSLAQQRFFISGGAYIGQQQKLAGGLTLRQVLPSSFTGDIPVSKSYHASFGFGFSYRLTGSKASQDSSQQPTNTPSRTKK